MAADQNPAPWKMNAPREAVAESFGSASFSVAPCAVKTSEPQVDDLMSLFAPPVALSAVSAVTLGPTSITA